MKFYVCNLGCKVNTYESNIMTESLIRNGLTLTEPENADIVIVNTCSVTDVALKKSLKMIRRFKDKIVAVVGCTSQIRPDLVKDMDNVKIVLGNANKSKIYDYIKEYLENQIQIIDIKELNNIPFENMMLENFDQTRAFVKVEDGCENFCSYCIIPYTRGSVRSRDIASILEEVKHLVNNGHKEIVLTGIHTGHYNCAGKRLAYLLDLICDIKEVERVRISSIEITELDDEFLEVLKNNPKIVNHIHIPLQTGCDKVLKDMNRKYDMAYFYDKMKTIKQIRPNMNITTDVIVGFPTETDEDFKETLENIKKLAFGKVHVFPYSKREGTPSAELKDLSPEIKKQRAHTLLELSKELEQNFLDKHIGKEVRFLPEVFKDNYLVGHTDDYDLVKCKGSSSNLHKIIKTKITSTRYPYCIGEDYE